MNRFIIPALLVSVIAFGVIAVWPSQTQASPQAQADMPMTITVSGSGTAYGAPDIAFLFIGAESSDPDVSIAVADANQRIEAIRTVLEQFGVTDGDVRTEYFNIFRELTYGPEGPTGEGIFRVNNSLRVTVRDTSRVSDVLTAVLEAGANSVNNVAFDIANRQALESEARGLAVDDARAIAEELAALNGVSLGNVVTVTEVEFGQGVFPNGFGGGGGFEAATNVPLEAGSLGVTITVEITFELIR